MEIKPNNTQNTWANIMGIVALIGFVVMVLPFIIEIDMMKGGGAMVMSGAMAGLTGLICYFIFRQRARQMNDLLLAKNILVRWEVDAMEWQQFAEKDTIALKKNAWSTWLIIAFFFVLFSVIFWFMTEDEDDGYFFLLLMAGIFAFISIAAWLATAARIRSRLNQDGGLVIISANGLVLNGEFHVWKGWGAMLDAVNYFEDDRILEFTYSTPSRGGRQSQEVRVPVPAKEEAQLKKILEYFGITPATYSPSEAEEGLSEEQKTSFKKEDNNEGFEVKF